MNTVTSSDHWSRCRHCPQLQLSLPLSLIRFCSSRWQWICNDHAGLWIRDGGKQVLKTAEMSGSASNAGYGAGYDAIRWFCLCDLAGCWCVTTVCTRRGGWSNYSPSLFSPQGGSHAFSDIGNTRIFQRRWGCGVLSLDCRCYGTPSWQESLSPAGTETRLLARGSWAFPEGLHFCWFW